MLAINDERFITRAEIIWEKGTNRNQFFRGEVDKYGWMDTGSSFLPSEIIAAYLYAQLENIEDIQTKRKNLWIQYYNSLEPWCIKNNIKMPFIPDFATNCGHMFYLILNSLEQRTAFIDYLKHNDIYSVFHYLSLHKSPYFQNKYEGKELPKSDKYTDCLVRLPLYYELSDTNMDKIINTVKLFIL
jgi:dTDP-4-amino-4,6-dideoxygalactose transaminase